MTYKMKQYLLAILLATATAATWAQAPAGPQAASQATAEQVQQNQRILQAALQVARLLDENKADEVWDGASVIAKKAEIREDFVKHITADRQAMGAQLVSRQLDSVSYLQSDGKQVPAGIYANVRFNTQFTKAKQPVSELVSFHLDDDKTWRVSGYAFQARNAKKE